MSYILDALKKSDQERQQGTSPNLYSEHGSIPPDMVFSPFKRHRRFWLIPGGIIIFIAVLGIFFYQYLSQPTDKESTVVTETAPQSGEVNETLPGVLVKEKIQVLQPIETKEVPSIPPVIFEKEAPQSSLPFLNELSANLRSQIPPLKFAGHTYAENPYQRMIIINNKILREGDMIDGNTRLMEINWEGVTIDFNGTRFQVKIN